MRKSAAPEGDRKLKTLVLGLGNPILSDDGVGVRVAEALQSRFNQEDIVVTETGVAGLDLLEMLWGYDRAIIIDAIQTKGGKVGEIYRLEPGDFAATQHAVNPHDINFATALKLGNMLGIPLPKQISILAIEVADTTTFCEECTPEVRRVIPVCVKMVVEELKGKDNA